MRSWCTWGRRCITFPFDHEPILVTGGRKRGPWEINYPFRGIREPLRSVQNISLVTQNTAHNCVHNSYHKSQINSQYLNFCWIWDKPLWSQFWVAATRTMTTMTTAAILLSPPFWPKIDKGNPHKTKSKNSFPRSVQTPWWLWERRMFDRRLYREIAGSRRWH